MGPDTLTLMVFHAIAYITIGTLLFVGFVPGYGVVMLGERLHRAWIKRAGWTLAIVGWIAGNAALAVFLA